MACLSLLASVSLTASRASAQQFTGDALLNGQTITNNSTWSAFATNAITKYDSAGLLLTTTGSQAGTGNVVISVFRGDGTNWETTAYLKWTNALAGNTTVVYYRELPNSEIGSVSHLRFSAQNFDASASGTNTTLKLLKKPRRG